VDTLIVWGSAKKGVGRVYSVPVASLPGARGDGQPITTLIDLETGTQPMHYFAGAAASVLLLSGTEGYGLLACVEDMVSRQKAGKAFLALNDGEALCPPSLVADGTHVCAVSTAGRLLTFELAALKRQPKGGRGLMLMSLDDKDTLAGAVAYTRGVRIEGIGRGGKPREDVLEIRSLNNARGPRGRKGKDASFGFKPTRIQRVA
jgi:topoisomerase-4 subunit A